MSDEHLYGHMVHEYYVERVRRIASEREAVRAGVQTPEQLTQLQEEIRRKLRRLFGPIPERTPLNVRITGRTERRDYVIEKLFYESRPGFPVTANLYIPKRGRAPRPAVLGTCGHSLVGKAEPTYQLFCKNLARMGYVVLIYDPISQGERLQFLGCRGRALPKGMCQEHNMLGNQMHLVGEFFGLWRLWDGIRGLDYLLSRPEVDATRVGVTGNSGGGTMTTYLTAFDDRFTMAAPGGFVTRYLCNLENELPSDSEQIPPGILAARLDMADFFVAQIPRPTILLGQENDFFDVRGLRATFEELHRLYRIAGAEDNIELFVGPGDHGYSLDNREAMYRFFNKHAGVRASAREPQPPHVEVPSALQVTPRGQVHFLRPRRVFDFTAETARQLAAGRKHLSGKALSEAIVRRLALPKRSDAPHYRVLRPRDLTEHPSIVQNRFAVETEPGICTILHIFRPGERLFHIPVGKKATLYVPHLSSRQDVLAGEAPKAVPLFALDVRGFGEVAVQTCNDPGLFAPYGADYMYASHGNMLDEPYAGRRVHDLLSTLDLLAGKGYEKVHLVGRGLGALWATFAACLHPAVTRVTLVNGLLSYHELTQTPARLWPLSSLVPGILQEFDLPDCLRELSKTKGLTVIAPWDAEMRVWRSDRLREHARELGLKRLRVAPLRRTISVS